MRTLSLLLTLAATALGTAAPSPLRAAQAEPGTYAFTDVTVIPMDSERVLPGHTVVVRDGVIVAVGPAGEVQVPADATRVDGRGRYLMPGLA